MVIMIISEYSSFTDHFLNSKSALNTSNTLSYKIRTVILSDIFYDHLYFIIEKIKLKDLNIKDIQLANNRTQNEIQPL
jgi:hypothetical protein